MALCLLAVTASPASAEKVRNHFDSDAPLRPPAFFEFVVLGEPGRAEWMVLTDFNPPSAPSQVTQTVLRRPVDSIAAALRSGLNFRDGRLSVGLRKGSGTGGLVFRMSGEKDFLTLLVDLATGESRLSSSRGGTVSELARGTAPLDQTWGILSITADGPKVSARWNEKPLLQATDPRLAEGRTGLATSGPGTVAFDEFVIEPDPGEEEAARDGVTPS